MTIRLIGNDALAEAHYADTNPEVLVNTKFFNERNGKHYLLDPHEALEMVARRTLKPEDLSCEALSIWEHLERAGGASGFLHIHPGSRIVLVLTRDQGSRLAEGIRGFAVLRPVFEGASCWARMSPVTDPLLDWEEFLSRLHPRLPLQKLAWEQNGDLRKHAKEIALILIDLFGLESDSLREDLRAKEVVRYDGDLQSYGGDLLDMVLELIRKTSFPAGGEDFSKRWTSEVPFPSAAGKPG
ncbi:MAG: hypothetical protein VST70_02530 [Nitrospirota bacterium]|nr:hypothetical protein [Nitrospirota bacterium]